MKKKFYVTTAIDYPNAEPHIGHAYQKVIADVLSRWNKLSGKKVWFLTGTDEHGKKIEESAEKAGEKPKKFVDEKAEKFKEAWKFLNIDYSRFIRTTDKDHEKLVQEAHTIVGGTITQTLIEGLHLVQQKGAYEKGMALKGKIHLNINLTESRERTGR